MNLESNFDISQPSSLYKNADCEIQVKNILYFYGSYGVDYSGCR